jgi:hypothetical protein
VIYQDHRVLLDLQVPLVILDHRAQMVPRALPAQQATPDPLALLAQMATLAVLDHKAQLDTQVAAAQMAP